MKFTVGSKKEIESYIPTEKSVLIRVFSSEDYKDIIDLNSRYLGVLELVFDDINMLPDNPLWGMFNMDEQAQGLTIVNNSHIREFVSFINQWENHIDEIVIHCDAGVSRSPALAIGLCYVKGWGKEELNLRRLFRSPNDAVLDLLEQMGESSK